MEITQKIPEESRVKALEIFYDAFAQKIRALIKSKEKALAIYSKSLNPERVFYAVYEGEVAGLIGLQYGDQYFMEFRYEIFREFYNPLTSRFYLFLLKRSAPKLKKGVMRIDSVAVDPGRRSLGIGSGLINKVIDFAGEIGCQEVILEVVNTNPRAKALYEKLGFRQKKYKNFYFLTRVAGFTGEYIMSYDLEQFKQILF